MDLRAEPTVITVPAVPKPRYYSVQLTDANTFNYGYIGSRATGTGAGDYMIVGPDWKGETPPHIKQVFHSTTPFSVVVFRTQLFDAGGHAERGKDPGRLQGAATLRLSQAARASRAASNRLLKANAEIAKTKFFEFLDFALQYVPAGPEEAEIRAKLASIGIGAGKQFEMKDLSAEHKAAILLGMKAGDDAVDKYIASGGTVIDGWKVGSFFGDRAFYNGDWLKRAAAAKGGNLRQQRHRGDVSSDPGDRRAERHSMAASTITR